MARHLAFIDRLLADKDKLSAKCVHLGKETKVASQTPSPVRKPTSAKHHATIGIAGKAMPDET